MSWGIYYRAIQIRIATSLVILTVLSFMFTATFIFIFYNDSIYGILDEITRRTEMQGLTGIAYEGRASIVDYWGKALDEIMKDSRSPF